MRETLKKFRESLRPLYGDREAEAIIRIVFHHLKGWDTTQMLIHGEDQLSPFIKEEANKILNRLLEHEPVQYITGEARFHGMEFKVAPGVLIPRPETEELVDIIVKEAGDKEDLEILDIGTGSGCIAITLARALKFPHISAIDISDAALKIAEENNRKLKTKVKFDKQDIFTLKTGKKFDIIVSNPPYIDESEKKDMDPNVTLYEPQEALFVSDKDPLIYYTHITQIAVDSLNPGGRLYFEINPRHADEIKALLEEKGFKGVEIIRDSFGKLRFVTGELGK